MNQALHNKLVSFIWSIADNKPAKLLLKSNKQRMKFSDNALAYLGNAQNRQDIKTIAGITGRGKQHSSYDYKLLEKFRIFLATRPPYVVQDEQINLKKYILIIDEINRANLLTVLGELIYALEYRGESITSMYDLEGGQSIPN